MGYPRLERLLRRLVLCWYSNLSPGMPVLRRSINSAVSCMANQARYKGPSALDPRSGSIVLGMFWAAYRYRRFIVDLASISQAPGSSIYRRYIVDISMIYELNVTVLFIAWCSRGSRGPCLRDEMHTASTLHAVCIKKLNKPDLMQHHGSLRDHSSWRRHAWFSGCPRAACRDELMAVDLL